MSVSYDPEVIQEFAVRLYRQARMAMLTMAVAGAVPGLFVVLASQSTFVEPHNQGAVVGIGIAFMVLGVLFGLAIGRQRSFRLKLQAQTALCQVQIAENTKPLPTP